MGYSLQFPYAWGGPLGKADFRTVPDDFVVDEELGFEPAGEGEHLLLHVRKRDQNTRWVAEQLAAVAGIQPVDVGYCGMKDRRAVTSQWFSLYLPKRQPDLAGLSAIAGVELLASGRHPRKLRRGEHLANRFTIRLRCCSADQGALQQRLRHIAEHGVPNYYGEQRFGRDGNNLVAFERRFVNRRRGVRRSAGRRDQGIYLSAGRSWVFNQILAARVTQGIWRLPLVGETQPEGALWGRGRPNVAEAVAALERQVVAGLPGWGEALEHSGLQQERRPLVLKPEQFTWRIDGPELVLKFVLSPGEFATSLLRELVGLVTPRAARGIVCASDADRQMPNNKNSGVTGEHH